MDIVAILKRPRTYVIAAALFIAFSLLGAILFGTLGGGQLGLRAPDRERLVYRC